MAYHHQQHIDRNKKIHLGKIIHILFSHLDQATFTSNAKRELYLFWERERGMGWHSYWPEKKNENQRLFFLLDYHKNEPLKPFSYSTKILLKDCLNWLSQNKVFFILYNHHEQILEKWYTYHTTGSQPNLGEWVTKES